MGIAYPGILVGIVYPGILVGIVLPGYVHLPTVVGIHPPGYVPPYHPWVYHHPAVPCAVRASSPAPAEVPDDEALGSRRRIPLGGREREA